MMRTIALNNGRQMRADFLVSDDIRDLADLLGLFDKLVPCPIEVLEALRGLPRRSAAFDLDLLPAVGAGEQRVVLKLSSRGAKLLSALRAVKVPFDLISKFGHDCSSVGCVDGTNEDRAPTESQGSVGACPGNAQRGDA